MAEVSHVAEILDAVETALEGSRDPMATLDGFNLTPSARSDLSATIRALVDGPEPRRAVQRARDLPEAVVTHPRFARFATCLHQGGYPARLCARYPEGLDTLGDLFCADSPESNARDTLLHRLRAVAATVGPSEALGRVRTAAYLELCLLETHRASLERVCAGLSDLADACVAFALEQEPGLGDVITVFGMGKLAGRELNFHSDIDLVFVHDDPAAEGTDGHRRRVEIYRAVQRVVARLEGDERWRPLFRVDLRLRPFGSRGPVSTSYGAALGYFESHGRGWERQVWMRARPIAGQRDRGAAFLAALRPFVYRQSITPAVMEETRATVARARRAHAHRPIGAGTDVKLDRGCIREIEFFLQGLLLLHGGKIQGLQTTSTMAALDRLFAHGLLSDDEHQVLTRAYRMLRRVEHRVQLEEGIQTHFFSHAPEPLALLAARLDAPTEAQRPTADRGQAFLDILSTVRDEVIEICDPESERESPEVRAAKLDVDTILDPMAAEDVTIQALERLGATDGAEALALLRALRAPPAAALNARGEALKGATHLLLACLQSAHPERALGRLVAFSQARPAHYAVWRMLARDGFERNRRLVAELLSLHETLSHGLVGQPHARASDDTEAISFLSTASFENLPTGREIEDTFEAHCAAPVGAAPPEVADAALSTARHRCLSRIALHDLAEHPAPATIGDRLSAVADEVVARMLHDVTTRAMTSTGESATPFELAIFALGKHGMSYLDYGSDLDLVFVYEPHVADATARLDAKTRAFDVGVQVMSRLRSRAGGARLYEVDTRLRPSGRQGLLVTSAGAFCSYHAGPLPVWERLASLWLRPVAAVAATTSGAVMIPHPSTHPWIAELCASVRAAVTATELSPVEIAEGWRSLTARVAGETSREARVPRSLAEIRARLHDKSLDTLGARFDVKLGTGGCLELELGVGALLLLERARLMRPDAPPIRSIPRAIEALGRLGTLSPGDARALGAGYEFLRRLLNRLRMDAQTLGDGAADSFLANSPRLPRVARRMGLEDETVLMEHFLQHRDSVHSILSQRLATR